MNNLNKKARIRIIKCLVEGTSIRATARIVGVSKGTVLKLLCDSGKACLEYHQENMTDLECEYVQVDEIWSFIHCKKKKANNNPNKGDSWTWTAICAVTKVVPCWYIGDRTAKSADKFIQMLSECVKGDTHITSDGLKAYESAVGNHMPQSDYGTMVKHYVKTDSGKNLKIIRKGRRGSPNISRLTTSFVERQNLNIRMGIARFARKTNAFSKKVENHAHALSLYFYYYNFIRIHKTLKTTPCSFMGIDREKDVESILDLIDDYERREKRAA